MLEKVYGIHSVKAVFSARPNAIKRMILLAGKKPHLNNEFLELAKKANIRPEIYPWKKFMNITGLIEEEENHQGVCIFTTPRKIFLEDDLDLLQNERIILVLDQISNTKNLATIIRSAAFFHIPAIILMKDNAAEITPSVTRVASGGTEFIKMFRVINLARSLTILKELGFWIYGLDERGDKTLAETDFPEKTVLIVGAEGEGLRQRTRQNCDHLVCIPGGQVGIESLNAGVAASIAMAEFFR